MNIQEFLEKNPVKIDTEWADSNPNMDCHDMNHYKVKLKHKGRQMSLFFSQGYGISGAPTVETVLECLSSDSSMLDYGFEEWADNLGWDSDSRKAEKTYKLCQRQAKKLENMLGAPAFQDLLEVEW